MARDINLKTACQLSGEDARTAELEFHWKLVFWGIMSMVVEKTGEIQGMETTLSDDAGTVRDALSRLRTPELHTYCACCDACYCS